MEGAYRYTGRSVARLVEATRDYLARHRRGEIGALGGIEGVCDTLECCWEPLTVAVRVCSGCRQYLGVEEWCGDDAHPAETWTVTHGLCDECFEAVHGELPRDAA